MLDQMNGQQLTELLAFAEDEPLFERRADVRSALQTFQVARMKGHKGTSVELFLLDLDRADRLQEQPPEAMEAAFIKMNRLRRDAEV